MAEFRIDFSILTRESPEENFHEVGFGSTSASDSEASAAFAVLAHVQNGEWDEV